MRGEVTALLISAVSTYNLPEYLAAVQQLERAAFAVGVGEVVYSQLVIQGSGDIFGAYRVFERKFRARIAGPKNCSTLYAATSHQYGHARCPVVASGAIFAARTRVANAWLAAHLAAHQHQCAFQ